MVTVDDILQFCVAKTCSPSALGGQLDQMRDGVSPSGDICAVLAAQEASTIKEAAVIRCLDGLSMVEKAYFLRDLGALDRFTKEVPCRGQGELIILTLRAYQEWATQSEERALVSVYNMMRRLAPHVYGVVLHDEVDLAQAFREGKAKAARRKAAELYADCYLVLNKWVQKWNIQRLTPRSKTKSKRTST